MLAAERRVEQARRRPRGRAGHAGQDDDPLAHGRDRDRQPRRGGRGRGHRHTEPAGDGARSRSPTCRWSRPRWRSTRPRSPRSSSARRRGIRIDAYPNQTFDGVVTEVGSSPDLPTAGAAQRGDQVQGQGPAREPARGHQARLSVQADILTGFRAKALAVPLQALVVRDAERKPGTPPRRRRARRRASISWRAARPASSRSRPGFWASCRSRSWTASRGARRSITGPFKALRTFKPGDAVKVEKPRRGGRTGRAEPMAVTMELGELLRASGACDPSPQAAQLPDPARDHHRRGDARGRRLGDLGAERLRAEKVIRPRPRRVRGDEVRDHPQPRGVPRGAASGPTSPGTTTSVLADHPDAAPSRWARTSTTTPAVKFRDHRLAERAGPRHHRELRRAARPGPRGRPLLPRRRGPRAKRSS